MTERTGTSGEHRDDMIQSLCFLGACWCAVVGWPGLGRGTFCACASCSGRRFQDTQDSQPLCPQKTVVCTRGVRLKVHEAEQRSRGGRNTRVSYAMRPVI